MDVCRQGSLTPGMNKLGGKNLGAIDPSAYNLVGYMGLPNIYHFCLDLL